ncbi:MAG: LexA family transcriptional regulator [Sphingobacterium sp.]|jgi:transcriptional regulator with XRE-family HTH domain|nr:LexA family transcriptional regulator [Sphingobacterium sp.]
MKDAKVFFHSNLKLLRTRRKYSQAQLAEVLGFTRAKYTSLENGKTGNPPLVDLIKIAAFFKFSVDDIVKSDLTLWKDFELRERETGGLEYVSGKKLRLLTITVNAENKENLEYIPVKAKAGYLAGHADPDFIAALPKFTLPNLPGGTFRMFPISGDSMLPLSSGSEVICRYVEDWREIKPQTPCILILNDAQDFVFKFVTMEEHLFLLESLNPEFKPYTVEVSDVLEIWQFHSYQSKQMPEPMAELGMIGSLLKEMREDIKSLKKK